MTQSHQLVQTRLESAIETFTTVAIGFIVSLAVWAWIAAPLYNIEVTMTQNLGITAIFTVSALIRGYIVRRFFATGLKKFNESLAKFFG